MEQAFAELKLSMGRKKQKMADEIPTESIKTTAERIKERGFFVKKIGALEKTLVQEKFDDLNAAELKQKCECMQHLSQQFENSCLALSSTDAVEVTQEDDEIEALKTKIPCRINALNVLLCSKSIQTTEANEQEDQPQAPVEI